MLSFPPAVPENNRRTAMHLPDAGSDQLFDDLAFAMNEAQLRQFC
jgi:hypothetical protein